MSDFITITKRQKLQIRQSLERGDIARIAARSSYSYQYVSRVLLDKFPNREIWQLAADYIKSKKVKVA